MRRVQLRFASWSLGLLAATLLLYGCGATENGSDATRTETESEPESSPTAESSDADGTESGSDANGTENPDEGNSVEGVGGDSEAPDSSADGSEVTGAGGATNPVGAGGQEANEGQGGASNSAGSSGVNFGGAGGSGPPPVLVAPGELLIPMEPQSSIEMDLLLMEDEAGNLVQAVDSTLNFAFGGDYPDVLQIQFQVQGFAMELEGARISEMSVEGAALAAEPVGEDTLEIALHEVGEFVLHVSGERDATEPGLAATPWSADVTVFVRSVGSARLSGCTDPAGSVLSGETINLSWLQPIDPNGVSFYPNNATTESPLTVTVHATPETTLTAPDGFRTLIAEGPEQTIRVTSAVGDVGSFELIGPERVNSIEAWFSMDAHWTRGLSLENGMKQSVLFDEPGNIAIQPRLYVDGQSLCNAVNNDWFEVSSMTPEVCPLAPRSDAPLAADSLPIGAQAIAPGICELRVDAPMFNGDPGLSLHWSVEFLDTAVSGAE